MVRILEKNGYEVAVAANGREAISLLEESNWAFDGILMDIQMPEMDGLQATRQIRSMELLRKTHIPVIALTAHAMERDKELCLAAGMDQYLTKPIQTHLLLSILEKIASCEFGNAVGRETSPAELCAR